MNRIGIAAAVLMMGSLLGTSGTVDAKEDVEYSPSVTVNKFVSDATQTDQQQHLIPQANRKFVLEKVILKTKNNQTFDIKNSNTYSVKVDEKHPISYTLITNEKGQAMLTGEDKLPKGNYQLSEVGENASKRKTLFALPYTDETGNVVDDIVLYPKSGLSDTNGLEESKPTSPIINGNNTNGNNSNNQDTTSQPTTNRLRLPDTKSNFDKILQTSGELVKVPWVKTLMVGLGSLFVLWGLFLIGKRSKDDEEEAEKNQ